MSDDWTAVDGVRADGAREWELFVRETAGEPLRHVGSVTAGSAELARDRAEHLFGWGVAAIWLCPADETRRFVTPELTLEGRESRSDADPDAAPTSDSHPDRDPDAGADA